MVRAREVVFSSCANPNSQLAITPVIRRWPYDLERMNENLILPDRVAIQLVGADNVPIKIGYVLFRIRLSARRKNDFVLQPFESDDEGRVGILKKELEANVRDAYDSDLMGHASVSECVPSVEIRILSQEEIDRAIEARMIWTTLLAGERDRWTSIEQLLDVYKNANNWLLFSDQSPLIRDDWNVVGAEYSYKFVVAEK